MQKLCSWCRLSEEVGTQCWCPTSPCVVRRGEVNDLSDEGSINNQTGLESLRQNQTEKRKNGRKKFCTHVCIFRLARATARKTLSLEAKRYLPGLHPHSSSPLSQSITPLHTREAETHFPDSWQGKEPAERVIHSRRQIEESSLNMEMASAQAASKEKH